MPFELPLEVGRPWLYQWFDSRMVRLNGFQIGVLARSRKDLLLIALIADSDGLPMFASDDCERPVALDGEALARKWRAPASFLVRRNRLQTRRLELLALGSQVAIALVYGNQKDSLLYFGSRSRSSLRFPSRPTSPGKHLKSKFKVPDSTREVSIETRGRSLGTYNSFFAYEKYAFIGEFYDSKRWHALEAHWKNLRRLDVSNCFGSIYTHSFAWATSTDAHSKAHLGKLPEFQKADVGRIFDKVMQCANWGETHGICVGPESSRVFAEIIFQKMDLVIHQRLHRKKFTSADYEILRYVDDFFIFSDDLHTVDAVASVIKDVLTEGGFSLNQSKTQDYLTPFTTRISERKASLKVFLKLSLPYEGALPGYDIREISVHLRSTAISSDNDAQAVGAALTQIERRLRKFLRKRAAKCGEYDQARELFSYVWGFAHSMLYQYLSNPSVSSSMKIVRTLRDIRRASELCVGLSGRHRAMLEFESLESLHFAVARAIRRLVAAEDTEIEVCHFLSLASASQVRLSSGNRILSDICDVLDRHLSANDSAKANQAGVFLLLSTMKYFLTDSRASSDNVSRLMSTCGKFTDLLFGSQYLPAGQLKNHASQELLLLALIECPYISVDVKFELLNKAWVVASVRKSLGTADLTERSARRFLRRCLVDEVARQGDGMSGSDIGAFVWSDEDFDEQLYEKEPQFIY